MKLQLFCALCLAVPIVAQAQNAADNNGRRAGETTLSGTVLSFNAATGALTIAVESSGGAPAPGKSPFATLITPADFKAPKRGTLVRATGTWDEQGRLQTRAIRTLTVEEALAPPAGRIAPGWPQRARGSIQASAVAAQLDGKGPLEIVLAAIGEGTGEAARDGKGAARLWAWTSAGQRFGEWPVDVQSAQGRPTDAGDLWFGAPSVADLDGDPFDEVAIPMPSGKQSTPGFSLFWGDGTRWPTSFGQWDRPDSWSSMPLVDVTGDGRVDLISGNLAMTPKGALPQGWSSNLPVASSYQIAWADMDGDGKLEGFLPRMERYWHLPDQKEAHIIEGMDNAGQPLAGWPQNVDYISTFVALGDISGDEKLEVVSVDLGGTLRAWTLDGTGVPGSKTTKDGARELRGALRTGMSGYVPLSLADLDGDGKAEIIAMSQDGELLTLKGDGSPWGTGTLGRFSERAGVAVADLGGDGEMDIFVGTKWIRLTKSGPVSADIVPRDAKIVASPSLCDLEGDGKADVLLASADGRVWVFQTEREIKPQWLQWQTMNANFRQNAVWFDPRKMTPSIAKWARGRFSPSDD